MGKGRDIRYRLGLFPPPLPPHLEVISIFTDISITQMSKQLLSRANTAKQEDFIWDKFLGSGAYGEVRRVTLKSNKKMFAIKKIDKLKLIREKMGTQISNEVRIMQSMKHPNIVRMFDSFESDTSLFIVLEYIQRGSLIDVLHNSKRLDETVVRKYMKDVINAVEYLHSMDPPIIHRDIKPENILIDGRGTCKLADFGWSNFSGILRITYCGTNSYLAPEMVQKKGHDQRLDYWCLGVLTYQLLSGFAPFDNGRGDTEQRKMDQKCNILSVRYRFQQGISEAAKNFISRLLRKNPAQRMNIQQMKAHQFIAGKALLNQIDSMQTGQQDGESQETDPFNVLADKLNKSQEINKLLKEDLQYHKGEVQRLAEQLAAQRANSSTISSGTATLQMSNILEQLNNKLRSERLESAQKISSLSKRVEFQLQQISQLEQQVSQLKQTNRQLRKIKYPEISLSRENSTLVQPSSKPSSESCSPSISRHLSSVSLDNDFKSRIISEFLSLSRLHQQLKATVQRSDQHQRQLSDNLSMDTKNIYEDQVQSVREKYEQKALRQFQYYTHQLKLLGVDNYQKEM